MPQEIGMPHHHSMNQSAHSLSLIRAIRFLIEIDRDNPVELLPEVPPDVQKRHFEATGAYLVNFEPLALSPAVRVAVNLFESSELFIRDDLWANAVCLDPLNYVDPKPLNSIQDLDFLECRRLLSYYSIVGPSSIAEAIQSGAIHILLAHMQSLIEEASD